MMTKQYYRDMPRWKKYYEFFPDWNRLGEDCEPDEDYLEWENNEIHLERYSNPEAKAKIVMLHGVGGNGRVLSFMAVPLRKRGFEVIAPDLPGYGLSRVHAESINYDGWIRLVDHLIHEEKAKDDRPIFLFGLSAGGMLSYHVTCINDDVRGLIATCILDLREREVLLGSASNRMAVHVGTPLLTWMSRIAPSMKLPMKAVANMKALVNDNSLLDFLVHDKTSAGSTVPVGLITSMTKAAPVIEPEHFERCPMLLVHPAEDRWVTVDLSRIFFDKLKCHKKVVLLENAGHLPLESPGLQQMEDAIVEYINGLILAEGVSNG